MVIPSALFGALHFQTGLLGQNAWLVSLATFIFGLTAAELTYRSNSIGPAIGLHFVNNVNALLITQMDGGLADVALFKTKFSVEDVDSVQNSLLQGVVFYIVLFAVIWFFWPMRQDDKDV